MIQVLDAGADQPHDPAVEFAEQMLGEMPSTEAGSKTRTQLL